MGRGWKTYMESIKRGGNIVAQYTENYNLELQQGADFINVNGLNTNFNTIDGELKNLEDNKAPKEHKHKTSDITDFPTALPADGGDADTVGGKSASDFRQTDINIIVNKDLDTLTNGTVYATTGCGNCPEDYSIITTDLQGNTYGKQTAFGVNSGITYVRTRLDSGYREWRDSRDGGNANTLDGVDKSKFIRWVGTIGADILNDSAYPLNYEGDVNEETAVSIGLTNAWWHVKYQRHTNTAGGFGIQVLHPLNNSSLSPLYRTSMGKVWDGWKRYGDGGNANTVDGFHLAVLPQATYDSAAKDPSTLYFTY